MEMEMGMGMEMEMEMRMGRSGTSRAGLGWGGAEGKGPRRCWGQGWRRGGDSRCGVLGCKCRCCAAGRPEGGG